MLHVYTEICLRRAHVSNLWAHPHMNESRHMYGWVTVHKHRHMPQMSPRLKTYHICMYLPWLIHVFAPWHRNSLVKNNNSYANTSHPYMDVSWHTYEWVIRLSQYLHAVQMPLGAHIWMSHVTCIHTGIFSEELISQHIHAVQMPLDARIAEQICWVPVKLQVRTSKTLQISARRYSYISRRA